MSRRAWEKYCDTTKRQYSHRHDGYINRPALSRERGAAILAAAKEDGLVGQAKINPGLTREQAHEVLSGAEPDGAYDYIVSRNIVREFTEQAKRLAAAPQEATK
jgi:hypothetical protein